MRYNLVCLGARYFYSFFVEDVIVRRKDVLLNPANSGVPVEEPDGRRRVAEIGFGNGEFLVHLARSEPQSIFYGLEISMICVEKALKRVIRENLHNVRLLCGDARFLLRESFADDWLDRIYMSFPCPWPKERHARRRVTAPGFADTVASVLKMGCCFELATDEEWYAKEVAQVLGDHASLSLSSFDVNRRRSVTTKYERKWLAEGKDIFILEFEKHSACSVERIVSGRSDEMHVSIAREKLDLAVLSTRDLGISGGENGVHWALGNVYGDGEGTWLVRAVTSDDGYQQQMYLRVVQREQGVLVKIDGVSVPYLTPAVRQAVQGLADHLIRE